MILRVLSPASTVVGFDMRTIIFLSALALVGAPAIGQELKPFEFRGFVAGQKLTQEQAASCKTDQDGINLCSLGNDRTVAGVEVMTMYVSTYNGMLSSAGIMSDPIYFGIITDAFKTKYGKPCKATTSIWVGELGNRHPNSTFVWCFRSGKLIARMYGARLDVSEFEYEDSNHAPAVPHKPKIDF